MVDVIQTMFFGIILIFIVGISIGTAYYAWGEVFSPTMSALINSTNASGGVVDVNGAVTNADNGLYLILSIIFVGIVAFVGISLLFDRERFSYQNGG